jgi:Protein of unknown function (DUF3455)
LKSLTALAFVLTLALTQTAQATDWIWRPHVPKDIEVDAGYRPFLAGHAIGTQNYICSVTPTGLKWVFIGPQATLFSAFFQQQTLTHFHSKNPFQADAIQATWQSSRDSSAVWAKKFTGSTDPAFVSPDAIEWLKLEVTGTIEGPTGGDKLVETKFIQRVNTVGGKEPATPCTDALLNTRQLVNYEADYYFYTKERAHR